MGWKAKTDIKTGLIRTIEHFKKWSLRTMHNIRSDFEENGFLVVPNLVDNLECSDIIKNAYEFHKNESCESYSPIMQPHRKSKNNIFSRQ